MNQPAPDHIRPGHTRPERIRVVVVTGLSGAGKTGALKVLEDLGYEAVDNLPLSLLRRLLVSDGAQGDMPPRGAIAAGIDSRTRDFNAAALVQLIRELKARPELDVQLVYFDCEDEVLFKRFTATRRRHPLADDRSVSDGIAAERAMMQPLRSVADHVFDTSALASPDMRRLLVAYFSLASTPTLSISVTSFSYRLGLPREADLVFDARFLRNPHYDEILRPRSGDDPEVGAYIAADPDCEPFMARVTDLLESLLPRFDAEGKRFLTIAMGCTGGRHRSVYLAEDLAQRLRSAGYPVSLRHRDRDLTGQDGITH
ncbi:RNase adapter RapZ [Ferrovibrio sp. MS7]|uniref:RNase adapter RapZ n=1 Tax=Ferrovibrio plantarum TaxID=3119164 RepID=UPI0031370E8B